MGHTLTMRASDRDRQAVVDLLQGAVEDGRLTMDGYVDRMGLAYQAVTYADLAPLLADLPVRESGAVRETSAPSPAGRSGRRPPARSPRRSRRWRVARPCGHRTGAIRLPIVSLGVCAQARQQSKLCP